MKRRTLKKNVRREEQRQKKLERRAKGHHARWTSFILTGFYFIRLPTVFMTSDPPMHDRLFPEQRYRYTQKALTVEQIRKAVTCGSCDGCVTCKTCRCFDKQRASEKGGSSGGEGRVDERGGPARSIPTSSLADRGSVESAPARACPSDAPPCEAQFTSFHNGPPPGAGQWILIGCEHCDSRLGPCEEHSETALVQEPPFPGTIATWAATAEAFRWVLECIAADSNDYDTRTLASAILNEPEHRTPEQQHALNTMPAQPHQASEATQLSHCSVCGKTPDRQPVFQENMSCGHPWGKLAYRTK